jgi:type IV secretory pathway TrbD component
MANTPQLHPMYVSLNKPLTIGGAERGLFWLALIVGTATFTFFGRLLAGILMFLVLFLAARWMTQTDRQLLRIILRSASAKVRYDASTLEYVSVQRRASR